MMFLVLMSPCMIELWCKRSNCQQRTKNIRTKSISSRNLQFKLAGLINSRFLPSNHSITMNLFFRFLVLSSKVQMSLDVTNFGISFSMNCKILISDSHNSLFLFSSVSLSLIATLVFVSVCIAWKILPCPPIYQFLMETN